MGVKAAAQEQSVLKHLRPTAEALARVALGGLRLLRWRKKKTIPVLPWNFGLAKWPVELVHPGLNTRGKGLATLDRRDARTWTRTRSGLRWCSASRGKPGVRLSTTSNGSMKKTTGILEARKPKRNKKAQQAKNGRITPRNARLVLFLSRLLSLLRLFRVFSGISVRGGLIMGCFGPFEGLVMVLITSEVRLRGSAEKSKTGRSDSALNGRRSEGMRKAGGGGC
jgi:hypothetical protein